MSCYFVAQIKIHDEAEYKKYLDGTDAVFAAFKGEIIAVDDHPTVLEGEWEYSRIVMIRFPDEADLRRWYDSPGYREIVKHRWRASEADVLIVKGR